MSAGNTESVSLETLIGKIKKDGVEAAEKEAEEILQKARVRAREMIEEARIEAEITVKHGEKEAAATREKMERALHLAARDFLNGLQISLVRQLEEILATEVGEAMEGKHLADLLARIIDRWAESKGGELDARVLLSDRDLKFLKGDIQIRLKEALESGLEIRSDGAVRGGFRIQFKNENFYHDFTVPGIVEWILPLMHPGIAERWQLTLKRDDHEQ